MERNFHLDACASSILHLALHQRLRLFSVLHISSLCICTSLLCAALSSLCCTSLFWAVAPLFCFAPFFSGNSRGGGYLTGVREWASSREGGTREVGSSLEMIRGEGCS